MRRLHLNGLVIGSVSKSIPWRCNAAELQISANGRYKLAGGDLIAFANRDLGERAVALGRQLMLHLHGFENGDALAFDDGLPGLGQHGDDPAIHRGQQAQIPSRASARWSRNSVASLTVAMPLPSWRCRSCASAHETCRLPQAVDLAADAIRGLFEKPDLVAPGRPRHRP